jgi:heme-degrading monooxygenase HmoA
MVTIGMNYRVRAGRERVFEDAFERVLDAMHDMPGHAESRLYRRVRATDPDYLVVSRWTDEAAFRDFVASDRFRKVTAWGFDNVLAGPPSHTTYRDG